MPPRSIDSIPINASGMLGGDGCSLFGLSVVAGHCTGMSGCITMRLFRETLRDRTAEWAIQSVNGDFTRMWNFHFENLPEDLKAHSMDLLIPFYIYFFKLC